MHTPTLGDKALHGDCGVSGEVGRRLGRICAEVCGGALGVCGWVGGGEPFLAQHSRAPEGR